VQPPLLTTSLFFVSNKFLFRGVTDRSFARSASWMVGTAMAYRRQETQTLETIMKVAKAAILGMALLGSSAIAFAQTPPTDPQTKTDKESPTTMGAGKGAQPADSTVGQKPATDPASKEQTKAPAAGSSGASSGEQGSDAAPGQKPATDPQSKEKNENPAAQ
jgi:hypothetical protein